MFETCFCFQCRLGLCSMQARTFIPRRIVSVLQIIILISMGRFFDTHFDVDYVLIPYQHMSQPLALV